MATRCPAARRSSGIPVYGGQHYQLHVAITEQDPRDILNTHMGIVVADVDAEHNWGIGSHDVRSTDNGRGGDYRPLLRGSGGPH